MLRTTGLDIRNPSNSVFSQLNVLKGLLQKSGQVREVNKQEMWRHPKISNGGKLIAARTVKSRGSSDWGLEQLVSWRRGLSVQAGGMRAL